MKSLADMKGQVEKFLKDMKSKNYRPVVIFNGHGCAEGLMLCDDGPIGLGSFLAWISEVLKELTFDRQIEIVFAQCYGHKYTEPDDKNIHVLHFTSDAKQKSDYTTGLASDNKSIRRSVHISLMKYVQGPERILPDEKDQLVIIGHGVRVLHGVMPGPRFNNFIPLKSIFTDKYTLIINNKQENNNLAFKGAACPV